MPAHPAIEKGRVALVTGAATGIGLAVAERLHSFGMRVALADSDADELEAAAASLRERGAAPVFSLAADVSLRTEVERLREATQQRFGPVSVLVNNAGTGLGGGTLERYEEWQRVIDVNLWGVIHGLFSFVPAMIESGEPGLVVNVGSKQGITCPPGNTPYNVSKAGVKVITESLEHELRNTPHCRVNAHLLVPGWTHTSIHLKAQRDRARLSGDATAPLPEPTAMAAGAWTAEQVVDALLSGIDASHFYILCPDNEVTPEMDRKRVLWAAGDLTQQRPPLSRWHADYRDAFDEFSPDGD